MSYTERTRRAIAKYGLERCIKAFQLHHIDGEGGSTVGIYTGLKTNQADAAIHAGEEVVRNEWQIERDCMTCSVSFDRYARVQTRL